MLEGSACLASARRAPRSEMRGCIVPSTRMELSAVCARASQFATVATTMGSGLTITDHVEDLLHLDLDIIVEAAGQASVATYGAAILQDTAATSTCCLSVPLAEDATYYAHKSATIGGGRDVFAKRCACWI